MNKNTAFVSSDEEIIYIGNENTVREISTSGKVLRTVRIINRRMDETSFSPSDGSEEFIISYKNGVFGKGKIHSSDCKLKSTELKEDGAVKKAVFCFEPYRIHSSDVFVKVIFEARDSDPVIRKYVTISSSAPKKLFIDYIDLEYFVLGADIKMRFSRPDMEKAYLSQFQSALGQPIYINGMYFGCEFPTTDNNIVDDTAHIRYFAGKTLTELSNGNEIYISHPTIGGAARSFDMEVVRADFLEYIKGIAKPIYLRTQYNSWYDHMLDITSENIRDSFFEIEKGLSSAGVPPLNSYVVDDGWVDYDKDFWCFNDKFPNELYESSALSKKFSSEFGLWLGPRGGYNLKTDKFGRRMERSGKGGYNRQSRDVCVADHRYTKNVLEFFLDCMEKFDINYWKLDGFLLKSCKNRHHGHPVGGKHGMYCFTDCWENWTDIFEKMHLLREKEGKDLWINQTSYCNASPWHLMYSESFWMQNSGDIGFIDKTTSGEKLCGSDIDRMLTYRDSKYFDFHRKRQYQFPLSNMYNHEPIYGNTAKIHMTDEEFRKYMYMISTRGTAFWELYYSFNLFTPDMWLINADVLSFIRENFSILRNSKLIGESPDTGSVYGYSAWENANGIVSVRNPANKKQSFSFILDRIIGVAEGAENMTCVTVLPYTEKPDERKYSYGDTVSVDLEPHEIRIFKFTNENTAPLKLTEAKFIDEKTVEFRFNSHIAVKMSTFTLGGVSLKKELRANYSDVRVYLPAEGENLQKLDIDIDVKDIYGNVLSEKVPVTYFKNGCIPISYGVSGRGDFALRLTLSAVPTDGMILLGGKDMSIFAANGKLVFDVKGIKAKSDTIIAGKDNVKVYALRERNGMIKLYIDGKLDCSGYDVRNAGADIAAGEIKCDVSVKNIEIFNRAFSFDEVKD